MHLIGGWAAPEVFTRTVDGMAANSPFGWYTGSLDALVVGVPALTAPLFTFGMIATGLGPMSGPLTCVAIMAGLWLNLKNHLIGSGGGPIHHGINLLMAPAMVAVWQNCAWRSYLIDALLNSRRSAVAEAAPSEAHA